MLNLLYGIIWLMTSLLWGGTAIYKKDVDKIGFFLALVTGIMSFITSILYFVQYFAM